MRHHIERLKQKPEHHRRAIAFGSAAAITGVIALVWMVSMSARLDDLSLTTAAARDAVESARTSVTSGLEVSTQPAQLQRDAAYQAYVEEQARQQREAQ